ncbi:MAG TPA: carbohydrate binding family 9 domain-containing protein [Planctomycetota bacterium]|nr:carbohydrate binding family 9 domain-containing protein [Planctomycetota bacterium]
MLLALLGVLAHAAPAASQADTPRVVVARRPDDVPEPVIDGVLDDPVWTHATPLGELRQVEPIEGGAPSERTEVHLLYDSRNVYVRLLCHDRDPAGIRDSQMKRDANLDPDDRVEVLFDPFHDRRNGFWFQIGAGGSMGDALVSKNGSRFDKQWDGIWLARSRVTERGWEAEMRIPVATLNFDPDGGSWGFNLRRFVRRRTEELRWAAVSQSVNFFWVSEAGELGGLSGLDQGLGLDVTPFVTAQTERDHMQDDVTEDADAGLDAIWRITPDHKLTLSYNTDFAETEVDTRQVNLTRFPLFFPEKRRFFLEDAGAFFFGYGTGFGGLQDAIPFFSRRIGLDEAGNEVPMLGAAKYTAQTERWSAALLDAQTEATDTVDDANLLAARVSFHVLANSDVGLIWTHGDPDGEGGADTVGADFNYRTESFLGDRNLNASAWVLGTSNDVQGGGVEEGLALSGFVSYPNNEVQLSARVTRIDDDFEPKLGFVRRKGIHLYRSDLAWRPWINGERVRRLGFELSPELITGLDHSLQTAALTVKPLNIEFESNDEFALEVSLNEERLDADFDITDDVTIPVGEYGFLRGGVAFESSDKRRFGGRASFATGGFFDGTRDDLVLGLDLRASRYALVGAGFERNEVRLPAGDFVVHVARLELTLVATPDLSWTHYLQYDDVSDALGLNSRLWWILRPGSSAFLVFNQGWQQDQGSFAPLSTEVEFKLGFTLRL